MNISAIPLSRARIREMAMEVRRACGMQDEPYFPIVEFIEWVLGDPENDFDYEIVPKEEMHAVLKSGK